MLQTKETLFGSTLFWILGATPRICWSVDLTRNPWRRHVKSQPVAWKSLRCNVSQCANKLHNRFDASCQANPLVFMNEQWYNIAVINLCILSWAHRWSGFYTFWFHFAWKIARSRHHQATWHFEHFAVTELLSDAASSAPVSPIENILNWQLAGWQSIMFNCNQRDTLTLQAWTRNSLNELRLQRSHRSTIRMSLGKAPRLYTAHRTHSPSALDHSAPKAPTFSLLSLFKPELRHWHSSC